MSGFCGAAAHMATIGNRVVRVLCGDKRTDTVLVFGADPRALLSAPGDGTAVPAQSNPDFI
jgi:hypothetical protein